MESLNLAGIITRVSWPRWQFCKADTPPEQILRENQKTVNIHFLQTFARQYTWVLISDIDEFLVFSEHETIQDFASMMEKDYPEVSAIAIPWLCFGPNGKKIKEPGLVIERFTNCESLSLLENAPIKTLFKPCRTYSRRLHKCLPIDGEYVDNTLQKTPYPESNRLFAPLSEGKLLIHHYITKSEEEFFDRSLRVRDGDVSPTRQRALENFTVLPEHNTRAHFWIQKTKKYMEYMENILMLQEFYLSTLDMKAVIVRRGTIIIKVIGAPENSRIRFVLNETLERYTDNNLLLADGSRGFAIDLSYYHEKLLTVRASVVGSRKLFLFDNRHDMSIIDNNSTSVVYKRIGNTRLQSIDNIIKYTPMMKEFLFYSITRTFKGKFRLLVKRKKKILHCFADIGFYHYHDAINAFFDIYANPDKFESIRQAYFVKHPQMRTRFDPYFSRFKVECLPTAYSLEEKVI